MWITIAAFTITERNVVIERAQAQLGMTVSTLADFNELAQQTTATVSQNGSDSRSAAIWRALLRYPTASIWVDEAGVVTAGEAPDGDLASFLVIEDARVGFTVHAALPRADAIAEWRRSAWLRSGALIAVSFGFLILSRFLVRALQQRTSAEREVEAAQERVGQLAAYKAQLEQTVAERTAELHGANTHLEAELIERQAAEGALREHDALLNVVTKSAAQLLGVQHEDAIQSVLELVGQTIAVSRVQFCEIITDQAGHLRSTIQQEWCAPGVASMIDDTVMQNLDLSVCLPRAAGAALLSGEASFFIDDLTGRYFTAFEQAKMRSFLQIPVMIDEKMWGCLNFVDSADVQRQWSWAESDTLKTLAGLVGVAVARARYMKELADANMIVQNSPTVLYRLKGEPPFPLIYVSHNIKKFGHEAKMLLGSQWIHFLTDPKDEEKVTAAMARIVDKDSQASAVEFRLRTGDGTYRWVENRYTPVRDKDGRLLEVEGIIIDITERKAAEEKIATLARTDGLTGLANRTTFVDRLRQAFSGMGRGTNPFAILYIDLDHFKDVNDTLGHPVGDQLLREVANRLRTIVRESDLVARLGGDEFAILQMDVNEPANAGALATKIQKSLAQPYLLDASQVTIVTASIGVCPFSATSVGPDAMLAQADLALYRSKSAGRNQYHFHTDDLDQEVRERVAVAEELKAAIDKGEFELFYQPQVEIVSGNIVGMEALLRWNHPRRGLLKAAAFIPQAEKARLTPAIGHWVLDQCCRQMRLWRDACVAPPVIAINLSLTQLKDSRELVRDVEITTRLHGLEPGCLEFDVTEATLAQATLTHNDALMQLRQLGAHIAIDDFGTEYSSFEYLRAYDVSHLKIAQAFINSTEAIPERASMIRAIIKIARELNIGVIAEGVETEEQRALLASTGSTHAQGYFFSEAVAAARADQLLREGSVKPMRPVDEILLEQPRRVGNEK
ncbi:MAG TPA: EAL domain-containing protein [Steroidobacteraceae bacterium]|nr:EAL domain-containing protein [Steroidobacteraceae bacterium]